MRYGIFSDIHSNLEAFEAVIKAYQKEKIDKYLCLGDVVGYGANPNECVDLLRALPAVAVAGNHDWASVDSFSLENFNDNAKEAVIWTQGRLSESNKDFLRGLELVYSRDDYVLTHASLNEPQAFNYLLNINDCRLTFELLKSQVCFIGHTHIPVIFVRDEQGMVHYEDTDKIKLEPGKKYVINAGSVGQPRDSIAGAAFCVWDTEKSEVEIKRAPYDVFMARQKIVDNGLPAFLGNRLLTGN